MKEVLFIPCTRLIQRYAEKVTQKQDFNMFKGQITGVHMAIWQAIWAAEARIESLIGYMGL